MGQRKGIRHLFTRKPLQSLDLDCSSSSIANRRHVVAHVNSRLSAPTEAPPGQSPITAMARGASDLPVRCMQTGTPAGPVCVSAQAGLLDMETDRKRRLVWRPTVPPGYLLQ